MKYCLIFDTHRGIYAGVVDWDRWSTCPAEWVLVTEFRHCYRFRAGGVGVYGLAVHGPDKSARIGPALPAVIVRDVSKILPCSPEAEAKLRDAKWAG